MKKVNVLIVMILLAVLFCPGVALAGDAVSAPAIFGELAHKAATIGNGLRSVGYIIAGLGLIFFSFMAIFNKISWKTLAYIMVSCFFLTALWSIIDAAATKGNLDQVQFRATGENQTIEFPMGVPPVK